MVALADCSSTLTHSLHHISSDLHMSLVTYSLKKDPYSIVIFHLSLEYSREIFQRTVLYHYPITRPNLLVNPDEAVFFYVGLYNRDDFFIDRGRNLAETDHAGNTSCETNLVIQIIDFKPGEDISRKQWFSHVGWHISILVITAFPRF